MAGLEKLRSNDPKKIGPYELVARLGSGGMGVVFLGTLGVKRVAIKIVRSSFLDDPGLRTRFQREIETLKIIDTPRVAKFLDSSIDDDIAWHAVEFVNGPTLAELVKSEGPLPEDQWWDLARELIEALEAIQKLGIIHRDVKPSNIIMTDRGLSLIDFGISQDTDATSLTSTGMVSGSPAWLAPEQLEGTAITAATDLFSAGSVLVFAAKGNSPWGNETSMTVPVVYQRILTSSPDLSGLSDDQAEFVSGLLNYEPKLRKISKQLVKANAGSPVVRERAAQVQVSSKPVRNNPKVPQKKITVKIKLIPTIVVGAFIAVLVPSLLFVTETVSVAARGACEVIVAERDRLVEVFRESHAGGTSSIGGEKAALEAAINKYRNSISRISPNLQITQGFLNENDRLSQELLTTLYNLDDSLPTAYAFGLEYKNLTSHIVSVTGTGKVCSQG